MSQHPWFYKLMRHRGDEVSTQDTSAFATDLAQRFRSGRHVAYLETSNLLWINGLILLVAAELLIAAVAERHERPWWLLVADVTVALILISQLGGATVSVAQNGVRLSKGFLGLWRLNLQAERITEAVPQTVSWLTEWLNLFAVLGVLSRLLRARLHMRQLPQRDSRINEWLIVALPFLITSGVRISTADGSDFVIASRHPDRLAAAIRAMKEAAEQEAQA